MIGIGLRLDWISFLGLIGLLGNWLDFLPEVSWFLLGSNCSLLGNFIDFSEELPWLALECYITSNRM